MPPPPDAVDLACDGCGDAVRTADRRVVLQVTGPEPGETRDFGTYCPSCWERLAPAIEVLEQLLTRSDEA
jgi:hypothetical protein